MSRMRGAADADQEADTVGLVQLMIVVGFLLALGLLIFRG